MLKYFRSIISIGLVFNFAFSPVRAAGESSWRPRQTPAADASFCHQAIPPVELSAWPHNIIRYVPFISRFKRPSLYRAAFVFGISAFTFLLRAQIPSAPPASPAAGARAPDDRTLDELIRELMRPIPKVTTEDLSGLLSALPPDKSVELLRSYHVSDSGKEWVLTSVIVTFQGTPLNRVEVDYTGVAPIPAPGPSFGFDTSQLDHLPAGKVLELLHDTSQLASFGIKPPLPEAVHKPAWIWPGSPSRREKILRDACHGPPTKTIAPTSSKRMDQTGL